jgi:hypothetical protein
MIYKYFIFKNIKEIKLNIGIWIFVLYFLNIILVSLNRSLTNRTILEIKRTKQNYNMIMIILYLLLEIKSYNFKDWK